MRCVLTGLIVWLLVLAGLALAGPQPTILIDDFEQGLTGWQEKSFQNQTAYEVVEVPGRGRVLRASSDNSASGLVKEMSFSVHEFPVLTWFWKIDRTLPGGNALEKKGDDYAARVYVIFPHWIKPLTRTINYIWANRLAVGDAVPNTYFSRAMMVAVESGNDRAGLWLREERNVLEDYRRLFGEEPPQAGAVAIMTDTDNTGDKVRAWYDDIRLWPAASESGSGP